MSFMRMGTETAAVTALTTPETQYAGCQLPLEA